MAPITLDEIMAAWHRSAREAAEVLHLAAGGPYAPGSDARAHELLAGLDLLPHVRDGIASYLPHVEPDGADAGLRVGDRVEGGEPGTEDYDTGRALAIEGDQVDVGWDSGVRTTQSADLLRRVQS